MSDENNGVVRMEVIYEGYKMISLSWWQKQLLKVFSNGHVPRHMAFIMDGNRRFAKGNGENALNGHRTGAETLKKCLLYALELGVEVVSCFAFSLQNFNRKQEQVQFLINLAQQEFKTMQHLGQTLTQMIQTNSIRVIIPRNTASKLSQYPNLEEGFRKIEERTKDNTKMKLYLCFAYDSVWEMENAVQKTQSKKQQLTRQNVFEQLAVPHEVDLLLRTSNEHRLSNFLLMQCSRALIEVDAALWPAFGIYKMLLLILKYNFHCNNNLNLRTHYE